MTDEASFSPVPEDPVDALPRGEVYDWYMRGVELLDTGNAAAAAQLLGGSVRQIEYAAEMGLEHHLGLTCDPIGGYVQIPCIERNAVAAVRAVDSAAFALLSDGSHIVSFDDVVRTMWETGLDLKSHYRETAEGGLAKIYLQGLSGTRSFPGMGS